MREILENLFGEVVMFEEGESKKQSIDQALTQIKSELLGKLPKENCSIILATEKRFQCETCSALSNCHWQTENKIISRIQQLILDYCR
jgi:hypothetical protein